MDHGVLHRLRVLIIGQRNSFDHVLAANIRCWGHEVVMLPSIEQLVKMDVAAEGDVLLYDLDASFCVQTVPEQQEISSSGRGRVHSAVVTPASPAFGADQQDAQDGNSVPALPLIRRRFTIAMTSDSVSRLALERINAMALLYKPFEMRLLQRYFRVLQRLLYGELAREAEMEEDEQTRVLVVDDDASVARAIQRCLLEETRYAVAVAHDGLEALEQFLDWRPRCVVTDLLMPCMNGYQMIRCLVDTPSMQPGFVVMSALHHHEMPLDRAYLAGKAIEYIDKPFQVNCLLSAVERACSA